MYIYIYEYTYIYLYLSHIHYLYTDIADCTLNLARILHIFISYTFFLYRPYVPTWHGYCYACARFLIYTRILYLCITFTILVYFYHYLTMP